MNTGKLNIIALLTVLLALSACSTTATERPILSATQVESMIRVEVRILEPLPVDETTVALAN